MKKIFLTLWFLFSTMAARADNMGTFLKSCAYGTLGGAAVGLASLAISDNPNEKISNVARGASLGLYVGIGYGIYQINQPASGWNEYSALGSSTEPVVWLEPITHQKFLDGAQLNLSLLSF